MLFLTPRNSSGSLARVYKDDSSVMLLAELSGATIIDRDVKFINYEIFTTNILVRLHCILWQGSHATLSSRYRKKAHTAS